jgi:phosphonate transport system substrate-binding protein
MLLPRPAIFFLAAALGLLSSAANAEVALNFGVYTSDKPSTMVRKFRPVLDRLEHDLSRRLGEPVTIHTQVARTYDQGVENLTDGRVDFSRLGPASYVTAKRSAAGISILAMEQQAGRKVFNGVICVAADSPIQTISDLRGKRFAFGDVNSTIGRYLAQLYLVEHGVRASDLAAYEYLGRHDKVGSAVAAGSYDAGALKEDTFRRVVENGGRLRALAGFQNVTKPWVARAGLPERLAGALRAALLEMNDPATLGALGADGFVAGNDEDFLTIRLAIEQNSQFFH